jgi:hypothetical protein
MKHSQPILLAATMVAVLFGSISATYPHRLSQEPPGGKCEFFSKTRHWVCDEFLEHFKTRGGPEIFGDPLSRAFRDYSSGLWVQYFQRARMEYHPDKPPPYRVLLGLLVDELGYHFPPARPEQIPPFNNALHHYFPETGHVVSYAFLDYFREKGGIDTFGYPRSEFMYEDGYIVQYFQRARIEWHPEDSSGPQIRVTNLGEVYIERFGIPEEYLLEERHEFHDDAIDPSQPTELNASASVRYAITGRGGTQTVFVYVNDQQYRPVEGAVATMVVHYPSGDERYDFNLTNERGFTKQSFPIQPTSPGQRVVIDIIITYDSITTTTQTFYLSWWR